MNRDAICAFHRASPISADLEWVEVRSNPESPELDTAYYYSLSNSRTSRAP